MSHSLPTRVDTAVVVGNPQPGSRTQAVAELLARTLDPAGPGTVVDLADLAPRLFDPADPEVEAARASAAASRVLVVATPVYKAGPTGLLKAFVDRFGPEDLARTVVVPVVIAASAAHGALADLQLRIVLRAVGARLPVPSLVVEQHRVAEVADQVETWAAQHRAVVDAVTAVLREVQPAVG